MVNVVRQMAIAELVMPIARRVVRRVTEPVNSVECVRVTVTSPVELSFKRLSMHPQMLTL